MSRANWRRGAYFPLAALLFLYAATILLAGWASLDKPTSSPNSHVMTFVDGLGGSFSISLVASDWVNGLPLGLIFSTSAQQAMLAAWAIFTPGGRRVHLLAASIAAAMLYALMSVSFNLLISIWKDAVAPFMLMPLLLLSVAAPLGAVAVCSGRRLRHHGAVPPVEVSSKHFSIANILLLTAAVAVALALARSSGAGDNAGRAALFTLAYSAVYVLPLVWCALAICRRWIACGSTFALSTLFSLPLVLPLWGDEWALNACLAVGLLWTVPASLLLWRLCGYRLMPSVNLTVAPSGGIETAAS